MPRPSAWEVSFPDEARAARYHESQNTKPAALPSTGSSALKRKAANADNDTPQRVAKRQPNAYYEPSRRHEIEETLDYRAPGEEADPERNDKKPIRVLSNFCVFEPAEKNKLVSLDALEDGSRDFSAVGMVLLPDEDDEDYGQYAPFEDDDMDIVRLNDIALCPFDYSADNAPVYIETRFAFYELRAPSMLYKPFLCAFLTPRCVARAVLKSAHTGVQDKLPSDEELEEAIPFIVIALKDDKLKGLEKTALLRNLLYNKVSSYDHRHRLPARTLGRTRPSTRGIIGDPDLALLRPENQSSIYITSRIAELAKGYFETDDIEVVGPKPSPIDRQEVEERKAKALRFLKMCLERIRIQETKTVFTADRWGSGRYGSFATKATIGREAFKSGDFVCIRRGHYRQAPAPPLHIDGPHDQLARHFWFARIVYFNLDTACVHLHWLEHGSNILLGDMANPQELFFTALCEDQPVASIAGKLSVGSKPTRKHDEYFVRFVYDERDGSFTSLDRNAMNRIVGNDPPDNCLPCLQAEEYHTNAHWSLTQDDPSGSSKSHNGVSYQGHTYHPNEFFLYNNAEGKGPAHIGYLQNIQVSRRSRDMPQIRFTRIGRIADLKGIRLGADTHNLYPERHVFVTDEKSSIPVTELIRPIHVYARNFFANELELKRWVEYSPYHFYCSYRLPSSNSASHMASWARRVEVSSATFNVCEFCPSTMYCQDLEEDKFDAEESGKDYDCLDLFGGTGAFSLAAAEGSRGCLRPTHHIEITPSAARTAQKNNSNLITYCQDANVCLRYFIKVEEGHSIDVPLQLYDNKTPIPAPIRKGKMRAIFAGLPCQSHSALNMYRKAEDKKSNLILTALSYFDWFRPEYIFLENVPGFLRYSLLARQAGPHRVEGGIEMGGFILLHRALLDMGYQIRPFLAQAGGHGAPQNRIRFFLIAALDGLPFPDVPQPTHDFEVTSQLSIKLPYNQKPKDSEKNVYKEAVFPVRTARGRAPHASVSIEDAIGDLPPFDWKHPNPRGASPALRQFLDQRVRDGIPVFESDRDKAHCGFEGAVEYKHEPRTSFQRQARERQTDDLQQYTRCLLPKTTERVVTIPVEAGSDYRSLPDNLAEWQFSNPVSAEGRNRYRGGLYGRLDRNGYFPTTVTNIHPTAKQSKVLHPDCLRMVSVRELARSQGFPDWFVFVARNDNVVTLHRQIGNAVPWQVSRALGRELRAALFKEWQKKKPSRNLEKMGGGDEDVDMG
ncbi:S-adenosyl-L-methionine-dependent methyltransferase [Mycena pura]|uniref:DNA (cytosine-5-)-methyltransferase n=1 Tax=Mycena pura TaxID=153505 RepID=A0AAD6VAM4_9AGAR|nr:S-adenosyl-L-methionine-dependent methyltransferase [Mycena pura]